VWCSRVDAEPVAQFVGQVSDGAGLVRYIALHFLKPCQAPPRGWRGHRFSCTRGYLVRPASEMREEARRSLRLKRALWRGVPGDLLEAELELEDAIAWELVRVRRSAGGLIVSAAPVAEGGSRVAARGTTDRGSGCARHGGRPDRRVAAVAGASEGERSLAGAEGGRSP
jgi:hypothetical protein